jgi:ectoine hydroxylase-related dioxygenase (phytanoyl-CoA dioxygenase family)
MLEAVNKDYLELSNTSDIAEIGGRVEQIPITAPFEETLRIYQRDGIVCLTDAVSRDVVSGILDEFDSLMATTDMEHFFRGQEDSNPGESILGVLTKRRSEILARSPDLVGQLLTQSRLLELVNAHLTKYATSVLIHQVLSLEVLPGEVAQALHRDNALWPIPGNRIPLGVATMVPLENFTAETGATQVILGSHLWPEAGYIDPKDVEDRLSDGRGWNKYHSPAIDPDDVTVVDAPLGSMVVFDGDVLHGGGANSSDGIVRKSILFGYCLGWLRGETNQQLMWPPEIARNFPREVQELIGYSSEGGILGCIQLGQDPIVLLEDR